MSSDASQRIVIVGGGMVGISLALMLSKSFANSRCPVHIALIEQFAFPSAPPETQDKTEGEFSPMPQESFDARSTALSAGSVGLLAEVACWSELSVYAEAIQHIHISDQGHYNNTLLNAQDYALEALGYVVENRRLGQCLLQQLRQTKVECIAPATVEQCRFTQQGVELTLQQPTQNTILGADLVLIADGAQSALVRSLGIESDTQAYQQSAIIANVALAKPHKSIAYERFTRQGPLALLPLNDADGLHRAAVVWTRDTQEIASLMSLSDETFLQALQACLGYRADYLVNVGKREVYPLQLVQAKEQVRSRVVIMGNAAHFLHPVAGQGFNLSLRDCATLAAVLSEHPHSLGDYAALKHYERRREVDQQITVGLTHGMVNTFSSNKRSLSILRQLGLAGLNSLPVLKTLLARQMMGVS
jgi:2-octaprenyl-6-methoxyphenol hydroxylase